MRFGIRETIFLLILLCVPVAAYFFVFQPRTDQINAAREEINRKQAKLKQLEAATVNMVDLGEEIDRLSYAIEVFEAKLPAQREVEVVLKDVWELAAANGLTPKSVRTDKIISASNYAELPLRMSITGDFDGFYSFLLEMEKLERITQMPKMKLKRLPNADEGAMQADIILSIFFEGDDSSDPKTSRRHQNRATNSAATARS